MHLTLLQALAHRDRYKALKGAVPTDMFDSTTIGLLNWYSIFLDSYPDREQIDPDALFTLMKLRANLDADQAAVTAKVIDQLKKPVAKDLIQGLVSQLEEVAYVGKVGSLLAKYNNGEDVDVTFELQQLTAETRRRMQTVGAAQWASADVLEYIEKTEDESGFKLKFLPALASNLRGLRPGDNIALAAPTDKGKTSFLMNMAADIAHQAKDTVLYKDRPLLFLVNEGQAEVLTPRMYQTVARVNRTKLKELAVSGELYDLYIKHVGRRDAIRFVNVHGQSIAQIARIIEAHKPYCVITDMTGRIRATGNTAGMNDISQLEAVWNSMREMAAIYDFLHIGTVQVSAEGFDMLYPPLSAMQNSKTGIQTTLDLALFMGAINSENMDFIRGISSPKNKCASTGVKGKNQFEVLFDPEINLWSEMNPTSVPPTR